MKYVDYTTEPELKPCPFCGSHDAEVVMRFERGEHFIVACQDCGARSSPCLTEKEAVKLWNQRVPEKFVQEIQVPVKKESKPKDENITNSNNTEVKHG